MDMTEGKITIEPEDIKYWLAHYIRGYRYYHSNESPSEIVIPMVPSTILETSMKETYEVPIRFAEYTPEVLSPEEAHSFDRDTGPEVPFEDVTDGMSHPADIDTEYEAAKVDQEQGQSDELAKEEGSDTGGHIRTRRTGKTSRTVSPDNPDAAQPD